jgi:hypothetical protein
MGRLEFRYPPVAQDATTFPFRSPTPYAMIDSISQCVLQTFGLDGTVDADALRHLDADSVAGKENGRVHIPALGPSSPFGPHDASLPVVLTRSEFSEPSALGNSLNL